MKILNTAQLKKLPLLRLRNLKRKVNNRVIETFRHAEYANWALPMLKDYLKYSIRVEKVLKSKSKGI